MCRPCSFSPLQECTENRQVLCANIVLDKSPDLLLQRVGNKIYEAARGGSLKVSGFPLFGPAVSAIQNLKLSEDTKQYQVCVRKHDRLVILQSLCEKWMSTEYKDETIAAVEQHNQKFNNGGEYWHQDEQRTSHAFFLTLGWCVGVTC